MQKRRISFEVKALVTISESWDLDERQNSEVLVHGELVSWSDSHELACLT